MESNRNIKRTCETPRQPSNNLLEIKIKLIKGLVLFSVIHSLQFMFYLTQPAIRTLTQRLGAWCLFLPPQRHWCCPSRAPLPTAPLQGHSGNTDHNVVSTWNIKTSVSRKQTSSPTDQCAVYNVIKHALHANLTCQKPNPGVKLWQPVFQVVLYFTCQPNWYYSQIKKQWLERFCFLQEYYMVRHHEPTEVQSK